METLFDNCKKRKIKRFDFDWKFIKADPATGYHKDYYDSDWEKIKIPHDWSIEGPFNKDAPAGQRGGFLPGGIGWYRKHFNSTDFAEQSRVFIQFDGVYKNSEVWLNGNYLGKRPSGYTSFQYDLTPFLQSEGNNVLAVRVDNSEQPNCRWYSGSGIYRHVWLIEKNRMHIDQWGTYITTPEVSREFTSIKIETMIKNEYKNKKECNLITEIYNPDGKMVGELKSKGIISGGESYSFTQNLNLNKPQLWTLKKALLYKAQSRVFLDGREIDDYTTYFGLREFCFDKEKGFILNGKNINMKGVNIHHDAGCLGAAVPDKTLEYRLKRLKKLGCNAIRTSHNPPAPEMLDICDRMGFLVIDESFDKWYSSQYGYGEDFNQWWEKDLQAMLKRDRNHPSIIMWSVGNEVGNQGSEKMVKTLKKLVDYVHENEPTRPVTCALHPPGAESKNEKVKNIVKLAKYMDVLSCNYQEQWYKDYKEKDSDIVIIGSESYPYFRGKDNRFKAFDKPNPWFDVENKSYVAGQFLWTGIDYLGEAREWPCKGWSSALIDTCGFRKPRSYFHQSVWSDKPMVYMAAYDNRLKRCKEKLHWSWPQIASHWNFSHLEGDLIKLVSYTNCEQVELILNGESYGIKNLADFPDKMIEWYLPYIPGEIKAIGLNRGEIVCSHVLKTAEDPAGVELNADRKVIRSDGQDVVHVEVTLIDENDTPVPDNDCLLNFEISGEGQLIGLDNGNLMSNESYKGFSRKTYRGKCLAVVQSNQKEGEIVLNCKGRGIKGSTLKITSGNK